MNTISLTGRLGAEPELKTTQSGISVLSFRLAVRRPRVKDTTDWIPCVAWRHTAEFIAKYTRKGDRIEITGVLTSREYEDRDGNRRTVYEVLCESVGLLESYTKPANGQTPKAAAETDYSSFLDAEEIPISSDEELPF